MLFSNAAMLFPCFNKHILNEQTFCATVLVLNHNHHAIQR